MNAFGDDYVAHNYPLIFLSGLESSSSTGEAVKKAGQDGGFRIKTDLPAENSDLARAVSEAILRHDGSQAPWVAQSPPPKLFTIRNVGRVGHTTVC
jgi:hypothetical protein